MEFIKQSMRSINQFMQQNLASSSHQYVVVGLIAFLGFPFFYLLWEAWYPQPETYAALRLHLFGASLGLGLVLSPFWPKQLQKLIPWFWFVALLYILPFFFTYLFLMNRANDLASMLLLSSVFLLVSLVDFVSLIVLLLLGISIAFVAYYFTASELFFNEEHAEVVLLAIFFIVAGSTVNYKKAVVERQRLKGMAAAAGMIAHELRTPLLSIKSGAQALKTSLPALFDGYRLAKEQGLLDKPIRVNRLNQLEGVNDRIINEINYANAIIDMLLIKAGRDNHLEHCVLEPCSMSECLQEAIERYPFRTNEARRLVQFEGDFEFFGSKLLMQHVLFNLMKNALYAIAVAERGEINISTHSDDQYHYLYFKDTGLGMSQQQLHQLFEHFYTTSFMGTGIGLSFCKLVMRRFGGDIRCESEEGAYTTFILYFPNPRANSIELETKSSKQRK
ncbi:sensor histidine kinase [Legionella yabuuchiae]|uniref:sensor histidine kinase n=1 Tax=Legionella yabuuchiae TaxID=376727 RepID=UPI001055B9EE|nr:HAMP domain-containing sensor histidine kinase [Legionella yabuuchiae]